MAYWAKMVEGSDVVGGTPTYETPIALPGAVMSKINPNGAVQTDWADNGPFFITNSRGNLQLSVELTGISKATLAAILGQTRSNGLTAEGALDQAPWGAFMFRVWVGGTDISGNKIYEYVSLPKGKFTIPESGAETKKESITFQHVTLAGEFARLEVNGVMNLNGRSDENLPAAMIAGWFTSPVWSLTQSMTAVTVGTITGDDSDNTITIPFAKSGETFSMVAPATGDIRVIVVSTGALIAGASTYALSVAGIAPTIIISNPNITAVQYSVTVANVRDSNGVSVTSYAQLVTPAA
jgi:phi13 family phage major tail protein